MLPAPFLKPFFHLGIVLTATAVIGLLAGGRMQQRGKWLPEIPNDIAAWTAVNVPLDSTTVKILGDPKTRGRQYKNRFGENIDAQVIAAESFDAYHEPAICTSGYGFTLTAQLYPEVFGKGNTARAMVLKHEDTGVRVLMLYWVQYEDGHTEGVSEQPAYADIGQRINIGWQTITNGQQSVLVRVYTRIAPTDTNGAQARRNLFEISRGLYEGIKKDGAAWKQRGGTSQQTAASGKAYHHVG